MKIQCWKLGYSKRFSMFLHKKLFFKKSIFWKFQQISTKNIICVQAAKVLQVVVVLDFYKVLKCVPCWVWHPVSPHPTHTHGHRRHRVDLDVWGYMHSPARDNKARGSQKLPHLTWTHYSYNFPLSGFKTVFRTVVLGLQSH